MYWKKLVVMYHDRRQFPTFIFTWSRSRGLVTVSRSILSKSRSRRKTKTLKSPRQVPDESCSDIHDNTFQGRCASHHINRASRISNLLRQIYAPTPDAFLLAVPHPPRPPKTQDRPHASNKELATCPAPCLPLSGHNGHS
jgi:hypothetical protein